MAGVISVPEQGQLVQVRSRPWVVNDVVTSSLPTGAMRTPMGKAQNLLTLSSVEDGNSRWGKTPFRIGLWVGRKTTPNRTDDAVEAIKQARGNQYFGGGIGTPYQLTTCPWCGSTIEAGKHLDAQPYPHGAGRTITYCGDKFGQCLFSKRQAANEGLPVVVVDEEIYRRLQCVNQSLVLESATALDN
jgi:hypothetical protein